MAEGSRAPRTFSVGFGDLIDELPFARVVSSTYGTRQHELQMDIPVGDVLERVVRAFDEPFGGSSSIPTFLVAEFARRHVKVVLSGDGGDELFGGYAWYRPLMTAYEVSGSTLRGEAIRARAIRDPGPREGASRLAGCGCPCCTGQLRSEARAPAR